MAPWLVEAAGAVELAIHAVPGAKRTAVGGQHGDALKIRLAAPAVEGKANAALVAFLAQAFGVPERSVVIVRGAGSRDKRVRIAAPRVRADAAWIAGESGQR